MDPTPGYDPKMPHDMAHFIVENEMGIQGGLFGQLAAGGYAGTFHPAEGAKKKGRNARTSERLAAANREDAALSRKNWWELLRVFGLASCPLAPLPPAVTHWRISRGFANALPL